MGRENKKQISMAQGQLKKRGAKNPMKKATSKKHTGPKKGARNIAPKKSKHVKAAKLKKSFEKAINSNIEQELASQAVSKGSKPLTMVKVQEQDKKDDKKKGHNKNAK